MRTFRATLLGLPFTFQELTGIKFHEQVKVKLLSNPLANEHIGSSIRTCLHCCYSQCGKENNTANLQAELENSVGTWST